MKVYVAGTMHDPRIADGSIVAELQQRGHAVVSRWHDPDAWRSESAQPTHEERLRIASMNFADLDRADLVLAVPHAGHHLRGAHTEIGYAIGRGKPVVILGARTDFNTMTAHPSVTVAGTLGEIPTNVAAPSARNRIFAEIDAERARQDARWGEQNHPMVNIPQAEPGCLFAPRVAGELECRRLGLPSADEARDACNLEHRAGHGTYASIAVEELAEAVEAAVIYGDTSDEARKELVQTAAVLVAMIECLDQKRAHG